MPIDNFKIVKQKQYNAFSYTTIGFILSYLQDANIDEDNGDSNMLVDGVKIINQNGICKEGNAGQRDD